MSKKTGAIKPKAATPIATPIHPGQYVRNVALAPKKMSVTAAAKVVGVGRPALSNFLNGKVTTTSDMAARIERAFGIPAHELLDKQAVYDAAQAKAKGTPMNAKRYVPPFLSIKANDIEAWASPNIAARIRLSVLLRTLVNSTGVGLKKVDFPGNDDAQRPGWDGYIEASQGTPWIPDGLSGWEFGTNTDIKGKADRDFAKSVKASAKGERDQTTFVFVTTRRWSGKSNWINKNKEKGLWKDVRVYDSSDLEQWLEQSIAGQAWFANETLRPSSGVRALNICWSDWANVADPPLSGALFEPAIVGAKRAMTSRLSKEPVEPIVIAADSTDEALAFIAQLFGEAGGEELVKYRDQVLVFDEPGVLPKLAQGSQDFIAVAAKREVERELGPLVRSMHTIVVYPRNATNIDPHVVLEPLNYEAFRTSLESMGYGRDDITKYSNESGRSLTVLRRRLSNVPAVRTPEWAADRETAASLIPFLFVGTWNSTNSIDQYALTELADVKPYETLEKTCQHLVALNDAPLWSVGTYRGVVSKIDLLFAIARWITVEDLKRYFDLARLVLDEDDPKLDLPESERWMAALYEKSREFSAALRQGVAETLVLLAVHGNHLFRTRLRFDCEREVGRLVRELLTPLKTRVLEANNRDLPVYAEAAPDEFLTILENDLKSATPESYGLMRPAETSLFGGGCARTGLLWALEGLAWNPETLPRVTLILARLTEIEIDDNWANKPISSLGSIFRAWMPQTAASHEQRLAVMKLIADKFPNVAWKVCVEQFDTGPKTGHYNHKPRWRTDGHGYGEPFPTWGPTLSFVREMIEMALGWENHTREMLCDLIERLPALSTEDQENVWELVKSWADTDTSDADKAFVREKIRVTAMSRRGEQRSKGTDYPALFASAKAVYQSLEPSDVLNKYEWLFLDAWVMESADELHDGLDYHEREERIAKLRADALREVLTNRGVSGVTELAEMGNAAAQIGWSMAANVLQEEEIPTFLLQALPRALSGDSGSRQSLVSGVLHAIRDDTRRACVLKKLKRHLSQSDLARLLRLAPFCRSTWQMVDELDEAHSQTYWDEVVPNLVRDSDNENNEAIERLLAAQRPRAAFACVQYKLEAINPELLFRLMSEIVKEGKDQPGRYQLDQYRVEETFKLIDKSPGLTIDQKASLEFAYIDVLSQLWSSRENYGIPNLEKYVESHPEFFVQAVVWKYKREDDGEDPQEWKVAPDNIERFAELGYKLLEGLSRIPGRDDLGELKVDLLAKWVNTVRESCAELGRLNIADECIGKLLSGALTGEDGVWPCEPVRQVMEDIHSKSVMEGADIGLFNSRGATWRGEGGDQERELADRYRAWANALQYSHPFVSSQLLMNMVKTYEGMAEHEDDEARLRQRML